MICGSCGEAISGATKTNQCPKCREVICPECGCSKLDPLAIMPKNENDTVGVVFGFKPYWKCQECSFEFKDSTLLQAENNQSNDSKQHSEDAAIMIVSLGLIILVLLVVWILLGL